MNNPNRTPQDSREIQVGSAASYPSEMDALEKFWAPDELAALDSSCTELEALLSTVRLPADWILPVAEEAELPPAIPGFEVVDKIGSGGFGAVYLARDLQLDRNVAIKLLRDRIWLGPLPGERLLHEARMAAALNHPGIVTLHAAIVHDQQCCLITEYVPGETLATRMARERIPPTEAIDLLTAIATALAFAHQHHVVHLDLKPQNILLDSQQRPRIADFGLAVRDDQQRCLRAGTLAYMAPEQLSHSAQFVDGRTDIWALGVLLYEMLTGELPFRAQDGVSVEQAIQEKPVKPPSQLVPGLPPSLDTLCATCLAKEPSDRFASCGELLTALSAARSTLECASERLPGSVARTPVLLMILLASSVLAASVLALSIQRANEPLASLPITVTDFRVLRYRYQDDGRGEALGVLGETTRHALFDDDIRVEVKFSRPAHAYLVELSSDGQIYLHHPTDPNSPPPPMSQFVSPAESHHYLALTDGVGVHLFVVVSSADKLPAFQEWRQRLGTIPWQPVQEPGVWRYHHDGSHDAQIIRERSTARARDTAPAALLNVCEHLAASTPGATIEAIAFPVLPKPTQGNDAEVRP